MTKLFIRIHQAQWNAMSRSSIPPMPRTLVKASPTAATDFYKQDSKHVQHLEKLSIYLQISWKQLHSLGHHFCLLCLEQILLRINLIIFIATIKQGSDASGVSASHPKGCATICPCRHCITTLSLFTLGKLLRNEFVKALGGKVGRFSTAMAIKYTVIGHVIST